VRKFYSVNETAAVLGKTPKAVWSMVYRRQIPFRKWGRRTLIPADDLECFLNSLPGLTPEDLGSGV
jgi:excisionase family DNA binding protein